jgi:ubiquinone/menaquinone biosynthesis C-methylase UbiE
VGDGRTSGPSRRGGLRERLVDATARRPRGRLARWTYGGKRGAPPGHEEIFDQLLKCVGPVEGERCLDVGCGGGRLLERLLAAGAAGAAGLDHSPEMLAFTKSRNRKAVDLGTLELELGDAARIPWPDETFGVLVCANMFFFLDSPEPVLAEFRRVLHPGGRLAIATQPGPLPGASLRHWWVAVWGPTMHVHSDEQMAELLDRAGFTQVTVQTREGHQLARAARPASSR